MIRVLSVVFRYLTNSDFFNIYKPKGAEERGGGQTYIDFAVGFITREHWDSFFNNVDDIVISQAAYGPKWDFPIHSIGIKEPQRIVIYQRRQQSISISSQRIGSANANRVYSWSPEYGFPEPEDPNNRQAKPEGLAIFLAKCDDGTVWAGWFQRNLPFAEMSVFGQMNLMENLRDTEGYSGFIDLTNSSKIFLDEKNPNAPFVLKKTYEKISNVTMGITPREERELTNDLLQQDIEEAGNVEGQQLRRIQEVVVRNQRAVQPLKNLYNGECQITGRRLTFQKRNGVLYSEAHHLIPLGDQGADSPFNIIIVSPLIHRMLHYARVEGLDLSKISPEHTLSFYINGDAYTITWHPTHAELVQRHQN